MLRRPTGLSILKIVGDCCDERQQKAKINEGADEDVTQVNNRDMLSRFMEVRKKDPSVPTW